MTVLFFKEKMEYCCFLFLKFIVILHFIVSWWITSSPNLKRRFGKNLITCSFCTYISRLTMGIFHLKVQWIIISPAKINNFVQEKTIQKFLFINENTPSWWSYCITSMSTKSIFCGFVVCIKELKILQEHKNITLKKPQDQ